MKGKRNADVKANQKTCTGILAAIPANELKVSLDMLLNGSKSCIRAGDYFEYNKLILPKKPLIMLF